MRDGEGRFDKVVKVIDLVLKGLAITAAIIAGTTGLRAYRRSLDQEHRRLIRSERYALCRDLVDAMVHAAYSKTPEEFFPRLEKFHELLNGRFFLIGQDAMMVGFDDMSNAIVDAARARAYIRIMPYSRRLALACRNALQDEFDRELNLREDQPSPAIGRAEIDPYTGPFRADAGP